LQGDVRIEKHTAIGLPGERTLGDPNASLKLVIPPDGPLDRAHQVVGVTGAIELAEIVLPHDASKLADVRRDDGHPGPDCMKELVGHRQPVVLPPVGMRDERQTSRGQHVVDLVR